MTTVVTITARLSSQKEVLVRLEDNGRIVDEFALQDGESIERRVYDGRKLSVEETDKSLVSAE